MRFIKIFFTLFFLSPFIISCSSDDSSGTNTNPVGFTVPATEDIVMYEINPSAFSTTKDLQGIINRLDNIKALGINTIWIMPIYPVGEVNSFGSLYCIKDYTGVRADLGTLENLKALVAAAHERNIAVILDWVANHTSWDNAWITQHPQWYTQDGNGNIIHPAGTNWTDVADLNFGNADMRLAMIDAMKYWVTNADVDGFRCDAADYVPFDFWQQANTALNAIPNKDLILLAEGARADHFTAGFQMNYSWDFLSALKNVYTGQTASNLSVANNSEYAAIPSGKRKLRFTTNHDESNIAVPMTLFNGSAGAVAASVAAIFMNGVPLIYCGQEVGAANTSVYNGTNSINWDANADMLSQYEKLLGFYNTSAAARKGVVTNYIDANVVAFKKTLGSDKVVVIVNMRNAVQEFSVPSAIQGNYTNTMTGTAQTLPTSLTLQPYSYLILKK